MMRSMFGVLALGGAAAGYMLWRRNHTGDEFSAVEPETYSELTGVRSATNGEYDKGSYEDAHRPAEAGVERRPGQG